METRNKQYYLDERCVFSVTVMAIIKDDRHRSGVSVREIVSASVQSLINTGRLCLAYCQHTITPHRMAECNMREINR